MGAGMSGPLVVVIDPGHGGTDPGCMWPPFVAPAGLSGQALERAQVDHVQRAALVEKDLALNIAHDIEGALDGTGWPVGCLLTRDGDESLNLDARGALGEKACADLVIALHCNAEADHTMRGALALTRGKKLEEEVGRSILMALPAELRRTNPLVIEAIPAGWTSRAHHVLEHHRTPAAALLVELGYSTHPGDRAVLTSEAGRASIVAALLCGIARFRQVIEAATRAA